MPAYDQDQLISVLRALARQEICSIRAAATLLGVPYLLPGRSRDKRLGTPRTIPLIYPFLLLLLLRLILMHGIVASKIYLYIDALHTVCKLSESVGAV